MNNLRESTENNRKNIKTEKIKMP